MLPGVRYDRADSRCFSRSSAVSLTVMNEKQARGKIPSHLFPQLKVKSVVCLQNFLNFFTNSFSCQVDTELDRAFCAALFFRNLLKCQPGFVVEDEPPPLDIA